MKGELKINIKRIMVTGRLYKDLEEILMTQESYLNDLKNRELRFLSEEEVSTEDFKWADAFVGFRPSKHFDPNYLQWVHSLGAGVDSFLSEIPWPQDVILTRTDCSFGPKIAEYCLSYVLSDLQHHRLFEDNKRNKRWNSTSPRPLKGQKLLVFGTGAIGQSVGKLFSYLGVEVFGVSSSGFAKDGFVKVMTLEETYSLAESIDIVVNTLPLTPYTKNLFSQERFALFHNTLFINVGRGASVNEDDLMDALDRGNLRMAVLDVFSEEPLPTASQLWTHPQVILTPHISALTDPDEASECFINTLKRIEAGEFPISNQVDSLKGY